MSVDTTCAAPAFVDVERSVELGSTEHACDVLFRCWRDEAGGEAQDAAPDGRRSLFGGGADHRALMAALRRLPPRERRVVRMRLSLHGSTDTIAAALDLPPSHVSRLLVQGLARVRDELMT
ncbi:sigma-70-like protein [Nocardiopsis sp. Huas11]|uniref:sigma factor-like helix-turn-helix DNA-binding protein n=1 Tax=Nocardiopsis sp. Huas11 TaxID=2183912 RepID=UPI000EAE30FD|nr:sigma factor-like helix-turn-helix DNA-binding protein [Nocardiopsis sp. Huas11]RKS08452.1 sigma-70-like protein [Nocardiopsis sp. Huas11]